MELNEVVTGSVFKVVTVHLITPEAPRCLLNGIREEHRVGPATAAAAAATTTTTAAAAAAAMTKIPNPRGSTLEL
jgi:hypothetical protein